MREQGVRVKMEGSTRMCGYRDVMVFGFDREVLVKVGTLFVEWNDLGNVGRTQVLLPFTAVFGEESLV